MSITREIQMSEKRCFTCGHREAVMHRGDQEWIDANPDRVNVAELILAKQRNGPCETVKLTFLAERTKFVTFNPGI